MYTDQAAREGYQAGPENFGYLQPVFVSDNQQRAEELGKRFLYGGAFAHFARPEWMFPPGYNSKEATKRLARLAAGANLPGKPITDVIGEETDAEIEALKQGVYATYDKTREQLQMIAGTPDYVIPRLRKVLEVLRPGIFSFWLDGPVGAKDRMRCLELLAQATSCPRCAKPASSLASSIRSSARPARCRSRRDARPSASRTRTCSRPRWQDGRSTHEHPRDLLARRRIICT